MKQKKESTYEGRIPAQYRGKYYHRIPKNYDASKGMLDPTQRWVTPKEFKARKAQAEYIINNPDGDLYAKIGPFGKPDCVLSE